MPKLPCSSQSRRCLLLVLWCAANWISADRALSDAKFCLHHFHTIALFGLHCEVLD